MEEVQQRIRSAILEGALDCSATFERIANGRADLRLWNACSMPESWIQACLMHSIAKAGFAVLPEARGKCDFERCAVGAKTLVSPDELRRARIDLFVGQIEKRDGNLIMQLLSAIEIKGKQSRWETFASDLKRLGYLKRDWGGDFSRFLVYVSPPKTDKEFETEREDFTKYVGLKDSEFEICKSRVRSCRAEESFSYVFLVEC